MIPRRVRLAVALCAVILCLGLDVAAAGALTPVTCSPDFTADSLNGGYFTPMRVEGVGCVTLMRVELGYQKCRLKHGLRGLCHSAVLHFRCRDHRDRNNAGPGNFVGVASCTRGRSVVVFSYEQNLQRG